MGCLDLLVVSGMPPAKSKTLVYHYTSDTTYVGEFKEGFLSNLWGTIGGDRFDTAHQQICEAAGIDPGECLGGYMGQEGNGTWTMGHTSGSINVSNGYKCYGEGRDAHGNRFKKMKTQLQAANYTRVSSNGSLNSGQQQFSIN